MVAVSTMKSELKNLKTCVDKGKIEEAEGMLGKMKVMMTELPSLPPILQSGPKAKEELVVGREVLETAVLLMVKVKDDEKFERNFAQLRSYYADTASILPASEMEPALLGLNLLRLLAANRIAEFHAELELIPSAWQKNTYIKHSIMLEQWLMEGAYNKVLAARSSVPADFYSGVMESLVSMVKEELAACSEKAYESLSVSEAKKMMLLESDQELKELAEKQGWVFKENRVSFGRAHEAAPKELPALQVINNTLGYARELERIV